MSEPLQKTRPDWVLEDPLLSPPPRGVELLVLTDGGVLIKSVWRDDYLAWSYKPKVPQSVKDRIQQKARQNAGL